MFVPRDNIGPEDGRVVRVRVLAPLALRHRLPVVVEHVLCAPYFHGYGAVNHNFL
jgi:hypothetical protein